MAALLSLERVSKLYGQQAAVAEASFAVERGELCAIVGPSGCGKTTTLKMINRIIEPSGGRILLEGRNVLELDPVQLRRRIGYVIQQTGLFPHLSVEDNVALVLKITGRPRAERLKRAHAMLELVGLPPGTFARRRPAQLSGGQQQRVGVARALAAGPELVLMDEPFAAVDPVIRNQLQQELKRIRQETGTTILFVTHDLPEAFSLGQRIVVFREGRVVQAGTPQALLFEPASPFVSEYLRESRELLGLRFLPAQAFAQPAADAGSGALPAGASVMDAIRAAGAGGGTVRLSDGRRHWVLGPADLVRAIATAVAPA